MPSTAEFPAAMRTQGWRRGYPTAQRGGEPPLRREPFVSRPVDPYALCRRKAAGGSESFLIMERRVCVPTFGVTTRGERQTLPGTDVLGAGASWTTRCMHLESGLACVFGASGEQRSNARARARAST